MGDQSRAGRRGLSDVAAVRAGRFGGRVPAGTDGPAYYATGRRGIRRDVVALLHPPYTAWHLSYVLLGGLVVRSVHWGVLGATVLAFFLAVGVAAHCLDELRGRPLDTTLPTWTLVTAAAVALAGAVTIGVVGVERIGPGLVGFVVVGAVLVLGYNLELFGGRIHTDLGFALAWGAFPVLTAAYAQAGDIPPAAVALAVAAALVSGAQRALSTPARMLRRRGARVEGSVVMKDGTVIPLDRATLLAPLEATLRLLSWAVMALALTLVLAHLWR